MHYKQNIKLGVIVSPQDEHLLHMDTFHVDSNGYLKRGDQVHLHKLIVNAEIVDHRDRNKLNCSRDNLRACTHQQNLYNQGKKANNTSGYKGVSKNGKKWIAQIRINGRKETVCRSNSKEQCALVYDIEAKKHHGEFACFNFDLEL